MSDIAMKQVYQPEDRTLPVFAEVERLMQDIGRRARELCAARGSAEGHELDDWLQAEHEICWPAAELAETDGAFIVNVALPGYGPPDVELTVTPREVVVHASKQSGSGDAVRAQEAAVRWSDFRANDVYRSFDLPATIDVELTDAVLKDGLLRITLPKAAAAADVVPIAAAA